MRTEGPLFFGYTLTVQLFTPWIMIKKTLLALALISTLGVTGVTSAQETQQAVPGSELNKAAPRKGWFWYQDPVEKKEAPVEVIEVTPTPAVKVDKTVPVVGITKAKDEKKAGSLEEDPEFCLTKDKWIPSCGFVDPGQDFDFQAKQRDALLQQMSMQPDKPEVVEAAQRYMKWIVGKASQAANMWYFNMVQNPDLDPTVKSPISEIGIALASKVRNASKLEYFRTVREEGGILFYFSRHDCSFCHDQAPITRRVARTMGLELINVPLDGKCIDGFEGEACAPNIPIEQIAVLNVQIVPSLYLYVPDNTWIRLGTGVVSDQKILANTVNFFSAYRAAMLAGIDNGNGVRPTVTFDPNINTKPTGTAPADGSKAPSAPDRAQLMDLMGYTNK